jgi:hypothetical protein
VNCLAQHVRSIRAHEGCDFDSIPTGIHARAGVGFRTHGVNACIGTAAFGQFHDAVVNVLDHKIECFRASVAGQRQPLRNSIDGDDAPGTEQNGAPNGELADRPAAPDSNCFAALDVAKIGGHVAGRENVGQKQDLLIGQSVRNLDRSDVGIGHTKIFSLAAGISAAKVRVAEQPGGCVAPQFARRFVIGIGALAA